MKQKVLVWLLSVCMVLTMMPLPAFAGVVDADNSNAVAEVGGIYYDSLQDAIDATNSGTVIVQNNVSLTEGLTIPAGKEVTLDLNGMTISRNTEAAISTAAITNNGVLTIEDSSATKSGKITAFAANPDTASIPYYASNTITNCGTLTVKGGTIENSTSNDARAAFPIDNNSTSRATIVNIEDGTITGRGAIRQFANSKDNANEVNISGGTVTGTSYGIWMQNPGSGDPKASLNISGGNVAKVLMSPSANFEPSITGGTIAEVAIWEADTTNADRNPSGFITGGTITELSEEMLAKGCVVGEDGTVTQAPLPDAEVVDLGKITVDEYNVWDGSLTEGGDPIDLQIALEFLAKDDETAAAENAYGKYTTDFYITIDGMEGDSFTADEDCYLAGNYGTFGWIMIPLNGMKIENGKVYPVITSVGFNFSYIDICTSVKDFKCGIHLSDAVLAANPDMNVNLTLGLSEDLAAAQAAQFITVGEPYVYDVNDLMGYVAEVNGQGYPTLQDAIDAAGEGDTVTLLADLTIESDLNNAGKGYFNIADGKKVTLDLNEKTIGVTDNSTGNFILFYNYGEFTIKNGTVNLTSTNNRAWNAESAIVLNRGGVLNVESGTYTHNGGTDMAFVLDNSGNYYGDATTNISGDTVLTSSYIAIRNRMEQNSHGASGKAILNVEKGTISGTSRAIWAQAASTDVEAPATGEINISGGVIGLIDTARSNGAVSMTTISGGTVDAVKCEIEELTVIGGAVGDVTTLTAAGEEVAHVVTDAGLYVAAAAEIDGVAYATLQDAVDAAEAGDTIKIVSDIEQTSSVKVNSDKNITIDLNGKTITGKDETTKSFGLIYNTGTLTIKDSVGEGKITLEATNDNGWSRYSSVISNNPGGNLTVESGTIKHLGGTSMSYGIDNLTNGKGTSAVTTINGGTIESKYIAIRQFLNGVEANNELVINGGVIGGENSSIYFQDPSVNANTGSLTITENATVNNRVYLGVTAGSTEWPVEISIAASALKTEAATIVESNIPAGYSVELTDGIYGVVECFVAEVDGVEYATLQAAIDAAGAGDTVKLLADISLSEGVVIATDDVITLDLNGKVVSRNTEDAVSSAAITNNGNLTIVDSSEDQTGKITAFAANPDTAGIPYYASNTITNCGVLTVKGGTIENSTGDEARAAFPIDNNSSSRDAIVNIEGGKIIGRGAIRQFANSTTSANKVNITGGTVSGTSYGIWVQNPGSNDPLAELSISGNADVAKVLLSPSTKFDVSISGGKIAEVAIWNADTTNTERNPSGFISGGTFNKPVDVAYCAEGYIPCENGDGTYGVVKGEYVAEINGKYYENLQAALDDAETGETVTLVADCEENTYATVVPAGVTLDLNGYYATVKNFLAFGDVVDTNAAAGGIKVSNDTATAVVQLQPNNTMLPIYDSADGCYRFFECKVEAAGTKPSEDGTAVTFGFKMHMNEQALELLENDCENSGLDYVVELNWTGLPTALQYKFKASTIKNYVTNGTENYAMTLKLTGLDKLPEGGSVTAKPYVESATGVVVNEQNGITLTH